MTDAELLACLDPLPPSGVLGNERLDHHLLLASSVLLRNTQSPTAKEYQGHVCFGPPDLAEPGRRMFVALVTYGPGGRVGSQAKVYMTSPHLGAIIGEVQSRVWGKLRRGYDLVAQDGTVGRGPWPSDSMTRAGVEQAIARLAGVSV
jgi:hypothetical protein